MSPITTYPQFFGFGSLVNAKTHSYPVQGAARVSGWQRRWVSTPLREQAFLSVQRCDGVSIQGLMAAVPGADWAALDEREVGYARIALEPKDVSQANDWDFPLAGLALYQVTDAMRLKDENQPIMLSYLDTVIQGYWQVFGEQGARDFFSSTTSWDRPIQDDRAKPLYPRHQVWDEAVIRLVDEELTRLS